MDFKLWSETNKEISKELKPDFGFRSWNELSDDDKHKIWKYLQEYFFEQDIKRSRDNSRADEHGYYYEFSGDYDEQGNKHKRIFWTVLCLNDLYKAKTYGKNFLEKNTLTNACKDFYNIFNKESENIVMELLSLYCRTIIVERKDEYFSKNGKESEKEYLKRREEWQWIPFNKFSQNLNEVFSHFGLNLYLTKLGFVPRQEEKILKEIFEPVINSLSHVKWKEVNKLLSDGFLEFKSNTPNGYSNCVTNVVSAIQAFLQILVNEKTGKGDISKLIQQAQAKKLIPDDLFSKEIFKNIESILMRERQETGISHPKKEYATEKNARIVLNLAMIFLQHSVQY